MCQNSRWKKSGADYNRRREQDTEFRAFLSVGSFSMSFVTDPDHQGMPGKYRMGGI